MPQTTFKMPKVSIILPNFCPDKEVAGYLTKFIVSLSQNTTMEYQLIVVENGSHTPKLSEIADIYIHKPMPIGYARAVNIGLSIADGEIFVIMNNDLEVPPNWLETMLKQYENGTLAPVDHVLPFEGIIQDSHWFSMVMINRETFTKVGYLDESLPYRFHDQDYSIRVKMAGFPVRQTASVVVNHINSATYAKMNRNEDPQEQEEMIRRYGVSHFNDYIRNKGNSLK